MNSDTVRGWHVRTLHMGEADSSHDVVFSDALLVTFSYQMMGVFGVFQQPDTLCDVDEKPQS